MALIKCPECGKEISSSVSKCPHCGFEIQGKKVTILGYTESFATSPSVTILKNGVEIGKVEQNGKLEIEIDQTCTLQFKCSMRSTECNVKPGDWVLLSFNRTTGSLTAILTDKDNYQFAINEAKGKDSKRWIWAIIIAVILFVIGYMLSACTTKTVQENTIESIEVAHEPIVPEEDISSYVPSDEFSVGMDMKIKFSPGNLQYCADSETWRFAENQYDMLGKYNEEISAFNEGWIDLFGWGTGDNPTVSSRDNYSYAHFSDWGENPISNVDNNITWRTLTHDEWLYLFHDRRNAVDHFGLGCVNGVNGIIILPDRWQTPDGLNFTSCTESVVDYDEYGYSCSNERAGNFADYNNFSAVEWRRMEANGAVFLPAAGYRNGKSLLAIGEEGYYWSSTPADWLDAYGAYNVKFRTRGVFIGRQSIYSHRHEGFSVRLVHNVE